MCTQIKYVLRWIHESPYESAHAGPRRFLARLQELFYWPTMNKDAELYATTCDVCQKIKTDHRACNVLMEIVYTGTSSVQW